MFTKGTPIVRCVSKPVKIQSRGFAKEITIHDYCANQTKRFDYENYLVGLFFPHASRRAFYAVRALNIDLANVKGLVKDPMLGKIRLQFWRDTLKDVYKNEPPEQPVAKALAEAIVNFKLSKTWFNKMIDQRDQDLITDSFRTVEDLETYAENTSGALTYLGLECLGIKNINADHAGSHIGKALGIAVLLRGTAYHSSKRHCYLPLELMSKHGVSQEKLYRGENSKELQEVVFETATVAKLHLDHARTLANTVPKEAFPALNSAIIADHILDELQKADFNVFDPRVVQKQSLLPVKLLYNKIMGKY